MSSKFYPHGSPVEHLGFSVQEERTKSLITARFRLTTKTGTQLILPPQDLLDLADLLGDVADAIDDGRMG